MQRVASFALSPPLSAPLRFFLTAPLLAMAAAALLAWEGPQGLVSRWSPATLAIVHLLTLGFLSMTMAGALLQILPVVAGVTMANTVVTARVVHVTLAAGSAVLATAFLAGEPLLFGLAMILLTTAFGWLLVACGLGMRRHGVNGPTPRAIGLALTALLVTVAMGLVLAGVFGAMMPLPTATDGSPAAGLSLPALTDLHAFWGLGGWVAVLVVGVAFQVVPMFQVTADYPARMRRWLPALLIAAIAVWSGARLAMSAADGNGDASLVLLVATHAARAAALLAGIGYAAFALATVRLVWRRKRPRPEPATLFWYLSAAALLGCVVLWTAGTATGGIHDAPAWPLATGVLAIVGFAGSAVNGMLYRIVPFLVWYHLQTGAAGVPVRAPNARDMIGQRAMYGQFLVHVAALAMLLAATEAPAGLARPAALVFLVSQGWLWVNLRGAAHQREVTGRRRPDCHRRTARV